MPRQKFTTDNKGSHSHSGNTNEAGQHNHGGQRFWQAYTWGQGDYDITNRNGGDKISTFSNDGLHSHTLTINSNGAHSHNINGGDAETLPKNINLMYLIKSQSSSLATTVQDLQDELDTVLALGFGDNSG